MRCWLFLLMLCCAVNARAESAAVAVAANFLEPLQAIAPVFREASGHTLQISGGSTGELYAQIRNGAPFEAFLAADQKRPTMLVQDGLAEADSRFTYALGKLVLWSADPARISGDGAAVLKKQDFSHLAIANPQTAPYGLAAQQALERLGLWQALQPKIVRGQNIGQTLQFVATGNAELGFVALAQLASPRAKGEGSRWEVPAQLYDPIRQDGVLLKRGAENQAARALLAFLRSEQGRRMILSYGYGLDD